MDELLLQNKICDFTHMLKHIKNISVDLKNLILMMVESDPEYRLTAEEALRHPFFDAEQTLINELIS